MGLTTLQKAELLQQLIAGAGGQILRVEMDEDCECAIHKEMRAIVARERQEVAKKVALLDGNCIEFIRIVREQLEADAEKDSSGDATGRLNALAVDLIKVLEEGWAPIPEMDQTTYAEEYLKPLHNKLEDAVVKFLVEAFGA